MNWNASATLWMKSSCRIVVMKGPWKPAGRASVASARAARQHDAIDRGDRERRQQEGDVDHRLPQHRLRIVRRRVDERLQQMDRRDADDRGRELDLEHACVDVRKPFGLVRMSLE